MRRSLPGVRVPGAGQTQPLRQDVRQSEERQAAKATRLAVTIS